jgi:hypothetical protein
MNKKYVKLILSIVFIWGLLFLLNPGYISGLVVPILFLLTWGASSEADYYSSNPRHKDINEVYDNPKVQAIIERDFWKPKEYSLIWLGVFLFLSVTPGIGFGYFLNSSSSPYSFDSVRNILWWGFMMPFLLISSAFILEVIVLQSLALFYVMVPIALFIVPYSIKLLWLKYAWWTIPIVVIPLVLPVYVLDLARLIREWLEGIWMIEGKKEPYE